MPVAHSGEAMHPLSSCRGGQLCQTRLNGGMYSVITAQLHAGSCWVVMLGDLRRSCTRLGYFQDDFVQHFVRRPSRRPPLINRGGWH